MKSPDIKIKSVIGDSVKFLNLMNKRKNYIFRTLVNHLTKCKTKTHLILCLQTRNLARLAENFLHFPFFIDIRYKCCILFSDDKSASAHTSHDVYMCAQKFNRLSRCETVAAKIHSFSLRDTSWQSCEWIYCIVVPALGRSQSTIKFNEWTAR
jgi:hypothetical protein